MPSMRYVGCSTVDGTGIVVEVVSRVVLSAVAGVLVTVTLSGTAVPALVVLVSDMLAIVVLVGRSSGIRSGNAVVMMEEVAAIVGDVAASGDSELTGASVSLALLAVSPIVSSAEAEQLASDRAPLVWV